MLGIKTIIPLFLILIFYQCTTVVNSAKGGSTGGRGGSVSGVSGARGKLILLKYYNFNKLFSI